MKVQQLKFTEKFIEPILDNGVSKIVKFAFPVGKELQKHKTTSDIIVVVLEGKIKFRVDVEYEMNAGDMISVEKNVEHAIVAIEESVVLLVMTPSPTMHTILKPK